MRHCDNCHGTGESGPAQACGLCKGFGFIFGLSSPPENLRAELAALKVKLSEAEALLRETREELHCPSANNGKPIKPGKFQYGHRCDSCDEYVDRNGKLRKKLDDFLSSAAAAT